MRWRRLALILCLMSLTSSCAVARPRPPLALLGDRPPLADPSCLTPAWRTWLRATLEAARENCVTLAALRGEDVAVCERGVR